MGFERCHPAVNFLYFTAVITGMITFQHPIFLAISFACAFAYSVKRNKWRAVAFNTALLPFVGMFALFYSSYTHFGIDVLGQNFIGNNMTLEALVYGFVLGFTIAGVLIWVSCVFSVFSTDKVVYLFGKISPKFSLFLAILLRMVPRMKREAARINTARKGIGRGANQGNAAERVRNSIRIFSMLITWTIESLITASQSMQSRGSTLRGRTAFSIYRFDNRDRAYVIGLFACMTVTLMAALLGQTDIVYNPRIILPPVTAMSWLFYAGYAVLCLMPLGLELWTEYRYDRTIGAPL